MSTPMRLNDHLVHEAEIEAVVQKRSTPKQIEYWAEIGQVVARMVSGSELLSIVQGVSQINVVQNPSSSVSTSDVLKALESDRHDGTLSHSVTQTQVWYESSQEHPGILDRVTASGQRESGQFHEGEFIPSSSN